MHIDSTTQVLKCFLGTHLKQEALLHLSFKPICSQSLRVAHDIGAIILEVWEREMNQSCL